MSTFFDKTKLRFIQESEVDYDSPISEELKTQFKENDESLFHLKYFTGSSGAATQAPTSEEFYDSNAGWTADQHNGRSLVILSGAAAGKFYTIDDTTGGADQKLTLTGDNLLGDGVANGDKYKIFYDLQSSAGHNHNAINSPTVVLAKGRTAILSFLHPNATSTGCWSTTSVSWTSNLNGGPTPQLINMNGFGVIIPQEANKLYPIIRVANPQGNARAGARIKIGAKVSSEVWSTQPTGGDWQTPTVGLDCSTMATGLQILVVQGRSTGGTTVSSIKGLNVVWGP